MPEAGLTFDLCDREDAPNIRSGRGSFAPFNCAQGKHRNTAHQKTQCAVQLALVTSRYLNSMLTEAQIKALMAVHRLGQLWSWHRIWRDSIHPTILINNTLVLRFYTCEASSLTFQKEVALYHRLQRETDLPLPRVLVFDTSQTILPYDVLILKNPPGMIALDVWRQLDPAAQWHVSHDLGQALAALHSVACAGYGGLNVQTGTLGVATDWQLYLLDKTAQVMVELWQYAALPLPLLEAAEEYILHSYLPSTPPAVVVHGDYGLHNALIMRHDATWNLSGLLNFEWALAADPEYEFATGLLVEPDEVNPLASPFLLGYRQRRRLVSGWEQRSLVYRLIYHLTLCNVICQSYQSDPRMLAYHRGMIIDILEAGR